jgi:F420H(2)-dependent quinone reductase
VGRDVMPVLAHAADQHERARLWPKLTEANPFYTRYELLTDRPIPIVILRPRPPA